MPTKPVTKEEILDIAYQPGMHWKSVNRNIMLAVMDKWAALQTGERDERIKELEAFVKDVARGQYGELKAGFIHRITTTATLLLTRPTGV